MKNEPINNVEYTSEEIMSVDEAIFRHAALCSRESMLRKVALQSRRFLPYKTTHVRNRYRKVKNRRFTNI
jgi:hypothetical protein